MTTSRLIIGLAAVTAMAGVAAADGYEGGKGMAPPPSVYNWSGVYMGLHGGYGWGESDVTENLPNILGFLPPSIGSTYDIDGGLGGVHLGMNKQYGKFVVGGEFRLSGGQIDGSTGNCFGLTNLVGVNGVNFTCQSEVNWVAAALAKLGYAQNRWMVYGTLGWAVAGVDHSFALNVSPALIPGGLNIASAANDTADGFAYGAGFEYAFANDISFGVEYTRMNLKSDGSGLILGGVATTGDRDIDLNTVTARVNFKWNGN